MQKYFYTLSFLLVIFNGCLQHVPITYLTLPRGPEYLGTVEPVVTRDTPRRKLSARFAVAEYLDREGYIIRDSPVSFSTSDTDLWGSPLPDQLGAAVRELLTHFLNIEIVTARENYPHLELEVLRFEYEVGTGAVVLLRWSLDDQPFTYETCTQVPEINNAVSTVATLSNVMSFCMRRVAAKLDQQLPG